MDSVFTTREWSVLFWLLVFVLWTGRDAGVRTAAGRLIQTALNKHILTFLVLILGYTALVLWGLSSIQLWDFSQWKATALWVLFAAPVAGARAITTSGLPNLFRSWVGDTFRLAVLIELIATSYTFNFLIELLLVPTLAILTAMWAVAEAKKEFAGVRRILDWVLAAVGFGLVARGLIHLFENWRDVMRLDSLPELYTVPLLTLSFIPLAYGLHIYSQYEQAIVRLKLFVPDRRLRDQAISRAMIAFGPRVQLLQRWTRQLGVDRPSCVTDVNASIREVLRNHRREKAPPPVSATEGWCPIKAGAYLESLGLKTNDYHQLDGEWFSASPMVEINSAPFPDNIAYYVEGDASRADTLKLKLNVNSDTSQEESEQRLFEAAGLLLQKAGVLETADRVFDDLDRRGDACEFDTALLTLERTDFPHANGGGYSLLLKLMRGKAIAAACGSP